MNVGNVAKRSATLTLETSIKRKIATKTMTKQTTQGMIDGYHFELTVDGPEALMAEIESALAELKYEVENE